MSVPSLLRLAEHEALEKIGLSGEVLDLGGDARSEYRKLFKGDFVFTSVNLDEKAKPDVLHDLEEKLPFAGGAFDHVLLINVLEHVFNYRQLLSEAARVVRPGGSVIIVVPFLFPVHPSPHDYWRFSQEALEKICHTSGLESVSIDPLGRGVFSARYLMLDRLLPSWLQLGSYYTLRFGTFFFDWIFFVLARLTHRKYSRDAYAMGYLVKAKKADNRTNLS